MKRAMILLAALALALLPCCAALAEANQTFSTDYYTLTLPGDWVVVPPEANDDEDYKLLGDLCSPENPGLVIEAGLVHYPDMGDTSLWNADEAATQDYIDAVLDELKDDRAEYVSTLKVGAIPFLVFRAEPDDGPYYYIDTMTNGYAVVFYAYVASDDSDVLLPMSDADWAQVEAILTTFRPAG